MDTVTLRALKIIDVVHTKKTMVCQVRLSLDSEHSFASDGQLLLKTDQCADILVVGANMIQQGNDALTVDGSLNTKVATIKNMLSKPIIENRKINLSRTRNFFPI